MLGQKTIRPDRARRPNEGQLSFEVQAAIIVFELLGGSVRQKANVVDGALRGLSASFRESIVGSKADLRSLTL